MYNIQEIIIDFKETSNSKNAIKVSRLKYDIIHQLMLGMTRYSEAQILQTCAPVEKEREIDTQKRLNRLKALLHLEQNFKKAFFQEEVPAIYAPSDDIKNAFYKEELPSYTLKPIDRMNIQEWQKLVNNFLIDNEHLINYLPTFLHSYLLKREIKKLLPLVESDIRQQQAINCIYYLHYKSDYLHVKALCSIIYNYAISEEKKAFEIFKSIDNYIERYGLHYREFYAKHMALIVCQEGQNQFRIKDQERRLQNLQRQLKNKHCQSCLSKNDNVENELEKTQYTLGKYKKQILSLNNELKLLRNDILFTSKQNSKLQQQNMILLKSNQQLQLQLRVIEKNVLNQESNLDNKQQYALQLTCKKIVDENQLLKQQLSKMTKENKQLRKQVVRSNSVPHLKLLV